MVLINSVAYLSYNSGYSINSILYQRGVYDPESFTPVNQYGLRLMVTADEGLKKYLQNVLGQLSGMRGCLYAGYEPGQHLMGGGVVQSGCKKAPYDS